MAFFSETVNLDRSSIPLVDEVFHSGDTASDVTPNLPVVLVDKVNPHLQCSVCKNVYIDPVINVKCGHTFCRKCVFKASRCPDDDTAFDTTLLISNRSVVGQIEDLLIHCCHGVVSNNRQFEVDPTGCPEHLRIGKRSDHEDVCQYAPVVCPHSTQCGRFRKNELEQHLHSCRFISCHHKDKGCEFSGSNDDITAHVQTCGYRGLPRSWSLKDTLDQNKLLEEQQRSLKDEVQILKHKVETLEEGKEQQQQLLNTCLSNYTALQQKHDNLQNLVEQLMTTRNRRSTSSPGNSTEAVKPRSASCSIYGSGWKSPPNSVKMEKWQMPFQFKCIGTLRGHRDVVWCLAMYKNKLCSSGADGLIKVWDLEILAKGCIKTMDGHSMVVHTMAVADNLLYTGGEDLCIKVWNLENYTEVLCVDNAHDNIITSMLHCRDYLITSSHSMIKVWEVQTLQLKHTLTGLNHWVRALCLNTTKDVLYSGSHNVIDIWEASEKFERKGKIEHSFGSVYSLAVNHQFVIAGTNTHDIHFFNVQTHTHFKSLSGHIACVTSVVSTASGRFLFSSSVDSNIQVWDLENMLPIQPLRRHEGSVNTLILHGDFLISGSEDHEIKVFKHFQMQMGFAVQT